MPTFYEYAQLSIPESSESGKTEALTDLIRVL